MCIPSWYDQKVIGGGTRESAERATREGILPCLQTPAITIKHLTILAVAALVACWPVLFHGLPDLGNDSVYHAQWAKQFSTQFWNGDLYPRWLSDLNAGYGAPSYYFYPPVPYFVSAVFWPFVNAHDANGFYMAGLSCALAVVLSALAAYCWCRQFADPSAALFGGLVYLIAPNHIAANLYTHGAAASLWAYVWMPLILMTVEWTIRGVRWAMPALAVFYALLIYSHLPTTLCFSLVPPAAALFLSDRGNRFRALLRTAVGMAIGIGLSAAYLLPAMVEQKNVHIGQLWGGFFDYRHWWLFQVQTLYDSRTRTLLLTLATMAFLLIAYAVCRQAGERHRAAMFYLGIALWTLFMMSQLSAPVWQIITLLQSLQFPNRFIHVLVTATAGMAALTFPYFRQRRFRLAALASVVFLCSWIAADGWAGSMAYWRWRRVSPGQAEYFKSIAANADKVFAYRRDVPQYWPRWTRSDAANDMDSFERFLRANKPRSVMITGTKTGSEVGTARVDNWSPRHVAMTISTSEPALVTLRHFYYPGWVARIGGGKAVSTQPSAGDGFLQWEVPEGVWQVELDLEAGRTEKMASTISVVFLLVVCSTMLAIGLTRKRLTPA